MPPDNAATVAPGTDVDFPRDGPSSGAGISRIGPDSFNLAAIGAYRVFFQVSIGEAGQLLLTLNGEDLDYTVAGRATGTSQIAGIAVVENHLGQFRIDRVKSRRQCCGPDHHAPGRWDEAGVGAPDDHPAGIEGFRLKPHKKESVSHHITYRFRVVPAIGFEPMTLRV